MFIVAALYKFTPLPDCADLREPLLHLCETHDIFGTLLLAAEGINGTVAGSRAAIDALLNHFRRDHRFRDLEYKESTAETQPFKRLKVRLRREIVTLGVEHIDPNEVVGEYVSPEDWNDLIADPDVVLIDTRNDYETAIGTFEGAIDPQTESFSDFPQFVDAQLNAQTHRKVAMFCTGGIRCEKATSYLRKRGFDQVYHLKGGILKYLETVPAEQSKWRGECFVFDRRVAVKHGLEQGTHKQCWACGRPVSPEDRQSPKYVVNESCPMCFDENDDTSPDHDSL